MPLVRCVEKGTTPLLSSKKTDDDSEEEESKKKKKKKDFELRDVWSAFHETSAFGCEVPLVVRNEDDDETTTHGLDDTHEDEVIAQYYASYVSAFQIFEKKKKKKNKREKEDKNAATKTRETAHPRNILNR